jgi:hypothetical protein
MDEYNTIYTTLDSILDTRYALLELLFTEEAMAVINETYHDRMVDLFQPLTVEEFKKIYAARDKNLLTNAKVTHVVDFVNDYITKANINQVNGPEHRVVKLAVNIHPYELNPLEISNIISTLEHVTNHNCDVELIDLPIDKLTPMHCKSRYSTMIMYEWIEWIEYFSKNEAFKKITLPEVALLVPGIYSVREPNFSELEECKKTNSNPFRDMEKMISVLVSIKFVKPELFAYKR